MEEIDADFLDDERARWNTATLKLVLFSKPGDAYTYYSSVVGRETARQEFAISEVAGWWGEGRSLERVWSDRGRNGAVIYNIYHENLVLIFTLAVQGLDATDAVGPLHDVARAVLEEVKLQLPCRSLVDPPVAGCDPQSSPGPSPR